MKWTNREGWNCDRGNWRGLGKISRVEETSKQNDLKVRFSEPDIKPPVPSKKYLESDMRFERADEKSQISDVRS